MKLIEIFTDKRGSIYGIEGNDNGMPTMELLLFTNKGFARGGCIHKKSDEKFYIVSGKGTLIYGDISIKVESGMSVVVPKGTPHYFISETDSVFLELGVRVDDRKDYDVAFRKIVMNINEVL